MTMPESESPYTNRLIHETSPYLRQHAHNPVDWYPWGEEALNKAKAENKPILLSIGYSSCHWCHVMERESFEDLATARIMNENFIPIKVDREERPDLDSIYMDSVQAMSGQGGWPMTVFLTPDGMPFLGGTYFPPVDRQGMPSFRKVMRYALDLWNNKRDEVLKQADAVVQHLQTLTTLAPAANPLHADVLEKAGNALRQHYEPRYGGWGRGPGPKFPTPVIPEFVLRCWKRFGNPINLEMVDYTLDRMARGGIYDHLGGGFHRYSVDPQWLVPHFEKMLYDNAQLARLYLHGYQATGKEPYRRVVEETLVYIRRDMTSPEGGFYSAQDADSEGEEGKYYVWTFQEIESALGPEEARLFNAYYSVTPHGNFEGKNILNVKLDPVAVAQAAKMSVGDLLAAVQRGREKLLALRSQRIPPLTDEKVLTSWNGLTLAAFAEAGAVLDRPDYLYTATTNALFLLDRVYRDGRLLHSYNKGQAKVAGYLEDYAYLAKGLIELYQATFEPRWAQIARALLDTLLDKFWDESNGGFFQTASDQQTPILRPKDLFDGATPSGNSGAAMALLKMSALTGEGHYADAAEKTLLLVGDAMTAQPTGFCGYLSTLDFLVGPVHEIAVIGQRNDPATRALLREVHRPYLPNKVLASTAPGDAQAMDIIPLLADRPLQDGRPTAYVCQHFVCQAPVTEPEDLVQQLRN